MGIKFAHTNIVAKDWRKLADFYMTVFECRPLYPERNLSGEWIESVTQIKDVAIKGIHLALPGYENGPTLEIFEYNSHSSTEEISQVNQQGFAHIAFQVEDVEAMLSNVLHNGGSQYGEVVTKEYESIGMLKVVYVKDPEGNIVELQKWDK